MTEADTHRYECIAQTDAAYAMKGTNMTLESLTKIRHESSRAVNAENPTGEPGKGGIAASELGPSRKGSPCYVTYPSVQRRLLLISPAPAAFDTSG